MEIFSSERKSALKRSVKTEHRAGGDTRATIIIEVSATRLGYSSDGRAQTQHAWGPEFKPQQSGRALRKIQDFALGNEKGDLRTRHKEGTSQSSRMEQCKLIWKPFIFSTKRASGCHAWVRLMMEVFPQVPPQKNTEATAVMVQLDQATPQAVAELSISHMQLVLQACKVQEWGVMGIWTKVRNIPWGQGTCGMVGFPRRGSSISCEDVKVGLSCSEDHRYWRYQRCKMFMELSKLKRETTDMTANGAGRKDFSRLFQSRWCCQQLHMLDVAMQGLVLTLVDFRVALEGSFWARPPFFL